MTEIALRKLVHGLRTSINFSAEGLIKHSKAYRDLLNHKKALNDRQQRVEEQYKDDIKRLEAANS